MVYLSNILVKADDKCAEKCAHQFVPRFQWSSCAVSEAYSKVVYARRAIRAPVWGLWIVCRDAADGAPAMPSPHTCQWPVDFSGYLNADSAPSKQSYILETMHQACLWVAGQQSWPADVFEQAYRKVLVDGFGYQGFVGRSCPTADKRYSARIHCNYGIEWVEYSAVLFPYRSKKEIARIPLGKLRPAVGRIGDDAAGGRWVDRTRFVLSSQFHYDWVADFSDYID
jgi:hypothetical protein